MNNNITTNSFDILRLIVSQWRWFRGLLFVIALEIVLLCCFSIDHEDSIITKFGVAAAMSVITFFVWVISTKRWFHRTQYWVLLWILLIILCGVFFAFVVYPSMLQSKD